VPVAVLAEAQGRGGGDFVEERHADRAGGGEIAFVGVVRALLEVQIADQLGDQEVEIGVALAMSVRRQVDRHAIDLGRQVRAVIEVESA